MTITLKSVLKKECVNLGIFLERKVIGRQQTVSSNNISRDAILSSKQSAFVLNLHPERSHWQDQFPKTSTRLSCSLFDVSVSDRIFQPAVDVEDILGKYRRIFFSRISRCSETSSTISLRRRQTGLFSGSFVRRLPNWLMACEKSNF